MNQKQASSPKWAPATKSIIIVILLIIASALIIRFSSLLPIAVGGLIFAAILEPAVRFLNRKLKIPWGLGTAIMIILLVLVFLGVIVWGSVSIVEQIQGLINFLLSITTNINQFLQNLSTTVLKIGPFHLDLSIIEWGAVGEKILEYAQPILSGIGNSIGGLASGAFNFFWKFFLTMIITSLILSERKHQKSSFFFHIPGYEDDARHFQREIQIIWNAFFKGQGKVFFVRICIYILLLGVLRVRYFVLLAFLAGIANFIPYIGVAVAWSVYFLVAVFQGTTIFGLDPLPYAALVSLSGWLIDNIYDNVYTPRVMAGTLKLHPASVMLGALVGLDLFGVLGMILASPLLATAKLFLRYIYRKIFDQDPWENIEQEHSSGDLKGFYKRANSRVKQFFEKILAKIRKGLRREKDD
ncbi:MAG TPA: AI-2E family transporter [Anaerolineaceae bacterium]|nr:AI-2E family transporter [Anaerolineaceae bacterium]